MSNRIVYIDNLKCFAIFVVMMGHTTMFLSYEYRAWNPLLAIIQSFQMPLFMAICGFFFRKALDMPFVPFVYKKFVALLLPAICWSFIKFAMSGGGNLEKTVLYEYWFLRSAFVCYLVCYLMVKVVKSEWLAYLLIIIASIYLDMYFVKLDLNLMLPSFVFGVVYSVYCDVIKRYRVPLLLLSSIVFLLFFVYWYYPLRPFGKEVVSQLYIYNLLRAVVGLSASLAIILIFTWQNRTTKIIAYIGASTLTFYVLNCIFSDVLRYTKRIAGMEDLSMIVNYGFSLIIVAVQIPLFYAITYIIRLNRWSRFLLLGNR